MADSTQTQPEAPFARLSTLDDAVIAADILTSLKTRGIIALGADGHFAFVQPSPTQILEELADVVAILKAHGVVIPPNVQRIIDAAPGFLPFLLQTASGQ